MIFISISSLETMFLFATRFDRDYDELNEAEENRFYIPLPSRGFSKRTT